MSSVRGRIGVLVQVLVALVVVAGCSGGGESGKPAGNAEKLPQGQQLTKQSSEAMKNVKSLAFTVATEGQPPIMVKSGDVKLVKSGDAQGTLQVVQLGLTLDTQFVLLGDTLYFKGLTGGYQRMPKSRITSVYDPAAILNPDKGIAKLLGDVQGAQTEALEKVNGKEAYRVKATLPKDTAATLVPGVGQDVAGKLWIAKDGHRLLKVRAEIPPGAAVVTFTEFDADYKITAPSGA